MVNFILNGQAVTGNQAELAYMNWCLVLENETQPVPRTGLDASLDFQDGAYGGNAEARARIEQSGIEIQGVDLLIGYVERYEPTGGCGYGNRKVYATRAKNEAGEIEFKFTYTPSSAVKLNAEWQEKFKAFAAQKKEAAKFMTLKEFEQVNGQPL